MFIVLQWLFWRIEMDKFCLFLSRPHLEMDNTIPEHLGWLGRKSWKEFPKMTIAWQILFSCPFVFFYNDRHKKVKIMQDCTYWLDINQLHFFMHYWLLEVLDVRISLLWLHQLFWLRHPRKHIQIFPNLICLCDLWNHCDSFFCTVEVSRKFIFSAELSNISALSE